MKALSLFLALILLNTCHCIEKNAVTSKQPDSNNYQNDAHRLVAESVAKTGNYEQLKSLVDATFQFIIKTSNGKQYHYNEKFIFEGEKSWAEYSFEKAGKMVHREEGFDGNDAWLIQGGKEITDEKKLKETRNGRKTSFYLFAMNQKLLDPGLLYKYIRQDTVDGQFYDVIEMTFQDNIGDANDIYYLYINRDTKLIDQYLLTIMAYDVTEPEIVRCKYEAFGPVLIPTYRKFTKSNWDGAILEEKWTEEITENLQFNQSVSIEKPLSKSEKE